MGYCKGCFEKQLRIEELVEENKQLKAQLPYRERKEKEGFFGASTPSSKLPVKDTTPEENRVKKGGARIGHPGHGRKSHEAGVVISLEGPAVCPACGGELVIVEMRDRAVVESTPTTPERLLYRIPPVQELQEAHPDKPAGSAPEEPLWQSTYCTARRHALLPWHPHGEDL